MSIINLSNQIYLYSIDTSAFYTDEELKLHSKLNEISSKKNILKKKLNKANIDEMDIINVEIKLYNKEYKNIKSEICALFKKNEATRKLNKNFLKPSNVVAMFDGVSTRTFDFKIDELSKEMFIVRAYFFDIVKDIMLDSFYFDNKKYIFFTASAGQIRTKKTIFIKESLWLQYGKSIMCGLTIEDINKLGGINVNKFLAYLALCNGATELMPDDKFHIKKTVVVNDFETLVNGTVDYIDSETYKIERKVMDVPITHTDGCGMILPRVSNKNFMIRLPWIKGLLSPFPFDEFIKEHENCNGDIVDIYGTKYNIFDDDIEVILTKSQFKMWKYYSSWKDYIQKYTENQCQAGKCNEDEDDIGNAKFNYQMLQTLSDMTSDELLEITSMVRKDIADIATSKKTMLRVFKATSANKNKSYLQQALEIYPELLSDEYCKDRLKMIKRKMVKSAKHAKFGIDGKYTFIIPDLYAFCEKLFLGIDKPVGLLADNEVYCNLFKQSNELDCLRSPHLYREHAVRKNIIDDEKSKWFVTQGLYTSTHDLISKLLQFDVDGDKSLVCADKTIINVAKRNMKDIVPLYYKMGTAEPVIVDNEKLYEGLTFAFANCNIGAVSNDITKIWNSDSINLDVIKLLTMENNFIIDAAKTLTKLKRPFNANQLIRQYTNTKLPHFFVYAKDKKDEQVNLVNNSVVNRLSKIIPDKKIVFDKKVFGDFDYTMLMRDTEVKIDSEIIDSYLNLKMSNKFNISSIDDVKHSNLLYIYQGNKEKLLEICPDKHKLTDMLVEYLYNIKKTPQKEALWYIFGDIILENLKNNLNKRYGKNYIVCEGCASRIKKNGNRKKYCNDCWDKRQRELWRNNKRKNKKFQV